MTKTTVVLPAYNAAHTLQRTIADIPLGLVQELVFVDDASRDNTLTSFREYIDTHPRLYADGSAPKPNGIPCVIVAREKNGGYGANQKTCYTVALSRGADIVVMLHPDYQYDPRLIPHFVRFIEEGYFDVMLGSRIRSRKEAREGGMPRYKYYANRALTLVQNIASGQNLGEWHTGMRAYSRGVLESVPFLTFSDDFVFDTQMLYAIVGRGHRVGDIPVPVRYFKEASSISFLRSCRYGILTLVETGKFVLKRH